MPIAIRAVTAAALLALQVTKAGEALGQEGAPPAKWSILAGYADGKVIDSQRTATDFTMLVIRWSRPLGGSADRFGAVSLMIETIPFLAIDQQPRAYGAGFNLLLRLALGKGIWQPALVGGIGMLVATDEVPPGESKFNWMPQVGVALRRRLDEQFSLSLEYRFHHISNGGLTQSNPGINTHLFLLGVSWLP